MTTIGFLIAISIFTLVMLGLSLRYKHDNSIDTFFAANRNIGVLGIAVSTAASWQWADNLFSTAQVGFDFGIHGILWFALTTVLSFVIFAFIAQKIREQAPNVYTIPEFVSLKTDKSKGVHTAMIVAITLYQLFTLTLGATITGLLLSAALGFNYIVSASSVVLFALTYSLISGLKASVRTDAIQFVLMLALMVFMIAVVATGIDPSMINTDVLFGTDKEFTGFFNQGLVLNLAIPLGIIIMTQPLVDQMIFQRLVALDKNINPVKPFIWAGLICGFIVLLLSSVGIFGQVLAQQGLIEVTDSQLTVVEAVRYSMSDFGVVLFVLAFLGVVFSTTDSAYSSIASLISIDVYKRYFGEGKSEKSTLRIGRISMVVAAFLAIAMSLAKLEILWMLFIIGAAGGTVVMPVLFSVYAKRLSPKITVTAILLSLIVSVPLSIHGNIIGDGMLVSIASLAGIGIGALLCGFDVLRQKILNP